MPRPRALVAAAVLAAAGGLAACAPQPFVDMRREAGTLSIVGSSSLERPAVCYNTMSATREQVQALADTVCAETGRVAVYDKSDLLQCTVLQPHRSLFRCVSSDRTITTADGIRRLRPGVLGVQVPQGGLAGQQQERQKPEDDLPIPQTPATPERPPSPEGEGILGIF